MFSLTVLTARFNLLLEHDLFRKPVPTFRDQALGRGVTGREVGDARRARPSIRIAIAAATRRAHDQPVGRLDPVPALAGKRASAAQSKLARRAGMSAGAAARRM